MKSSVLKASLISLAIPALVLLVASGCGGGKSASPTPGGGEVIITSYTPTPGGPVTTPTPVSSLAGARTADFATLCQKSPARLFDRPDTVIDPKRSYTATISTEKGDISADLYPAVAPVNVNNFVFLACKGFYDGVTFHRVLPGFIAQAGDPTGLGNGGPGYAIADEYSNLPFEAGTLGVARASAPNTGGSQFFISLALQPDLDGKYTVLGKVTSGMDVVDKLAPRDPATPSLPPGDKILTITVQEH